MRNTFFAPGTLLSSQHWERVEEVITAAFPSAAVAFNPVLYSSAVGTRTGTSREGNAPCRRNPLNINAQLEQHAPSDWNGEVGRTCSAFNTTDTSGPSGLWKSLYHYFGVTSSRCPWLGADDLDSRVGPVSAFPCWTPHAVVFVGGYERIDLRRIVLPALEEHVPSQEIDLYSKARRDTKVPCDQRRRPRYEEHYEKEREMLQKRGCSILGDDTMQLSVWLEDATTEGTWWPTFLSFANPATRLSDLHKEKDSMKCNRYRSAFGYSLPLLIHALPPPMLLAARILDSCGSTTKHSSLPFWLSATAHSVGRTTARCISCQASKSSLLSRNALQYLSHIESKLQDVTERREEQHLPRLVESQLMAYVLALKVLDDLNEREEPFLHNYFLPQEAFQDYEDVQFALRKKTALLGYVRNQLALKDLSKIPPLNLYNKVK